MSFDYDPQDETHISGADFAQMCDEMKQLREEIANGTMALLGIVMMGLRSGIRRRQV